MSNPSPTPAPPHAPLGAVAPPRVRGTVRELARLGERPNWGAGVRAAVATVAPVLLVHALGLGSGTWAGLGGFITALGDKGGAYRTRAQTMAAVALAGAAAAVLGTVAGTRPALVIPLILFWAGAGALLRVFGAAAGTVGTSASIIFIISTAAPASFSAALRTHAVLLLGGAALAMALALVLWPIRAYAPARRSLAAAWRALAGYAGAVADGTPRDFGVFRAALEEARTTLANTRRGRSGESGRGERLLMLAEMADRSFTATTALAGALDAGSVGVMAEARARAAAAQAARTARELAESVERERPPKPADDWPEPPAPAAGEPTDALVATLRREVLLGWAAAAGVESGKRAITPVTPTPDAAPGIAETLRANLDLRSVAFRHALRVGVTAAAACALGEALGVQRGYWITLTALIVLQPSAGATWVKGVQRIAGTVAGAIVAALVVATVHNPWVMMGIIFLFAAAAVSVLQVNYGVYSALLTPTFVLLAEASAPDRHLPMVRVVNTLLGGVLALGAVRLLWPAPERLAFRGRLALAMRVCAAYVRAAARSHAGVAARPEADAARRDAGLALLNAEESLQLLLWEGRPGDAGEQGMAALAYLRRLAEAANALAYAARAPEESAAVTAFGDTAAGALETLANGWEAGEGPASCLAMPVPGVAGPVTAIHLHALEEEIRALEGVLAR